MSRQLLLTVICLLYCSGVLYAANPLLVIDSGGHTRLIQKLVFTKDGKQLVSVGDDKVIRIWDVQTGRTVRVIRDQVGTCADCRVMTIALSPDNKYLGVGGKFPGMTPAAQFAVYIYNFETGQRLQQLAGHQARVISLAFSQDGNKLASGSAFAEGFDRTADEAGPIRLWKLGEQGWEPSGQLRGHAEGVSCLALSPDGQRLVSGGTDTDLFLWNLAGGSRSPKLLKKHVNSIFGVAFSPDEQYIVSASLDRKIYLWDANGRFVKQLSEQPRGITSLDISSNKERMRVLIGLEDGTAKVLALPDGSEIRTFKQDNDRVYAAALSRNDNLAASSGGFNGEIWLWNVDSKPVTSDLLPGKDGQTLWKVDFDKKVLAGKGQTVWRVGFAQDGNSIAFGTQHTSDEPNNYGPLQRIIDLKSTYATTAQTTMQRYRIRLGGRITNESQYYSAIVKSPQGELRTKYGRMLPGKVEPVRLNELEVWKNGNLVHSIKRDLTTGRTHRSFTFTPDGSYIVSGGEGGYLAIYETKDPSKPIRQFIGHTSDVWGVAVSPDGRFVVSGSSDQTIKLWDIKSARYLLSIFVATDSEWVAWTPEGYYVSSLNGDRYFGWQVEQEGAGPEYYKAAQFQKIFYRPDVVSEYLETGDIEIALDLASPGRALTASNQAAKISDFIVTARDLAQALPPRIQIISPVDKETVTSRLLKVKLLVTSENFPITNVSVSLNGFQRATYTGAESKSRKVEMETVLILEPNENTLVVIASHENATSAPESRTIFYKSGSAGANVLLSPDAKGRPARTSHHGNVAVKPRPDVPEIEIVDPIDSPDPIAISVDYFTLRVRVPAEVRGTDIKVKILVNGEELHKQTIQPGINSPIQIPLEREGDYTISAIAVVDGVNSAPKTRKIRFSRAAEGRPNLIFLGIGIKGYTNLQPELRFSDKDALDLGKLLCRLHNSSAFKEVKALVLSNEQVTEDNILKGISWLNENAVHDNDVRVVLFSGHGGTHGNSVKRYYFYPRDYVPGEEPRAYKAPVWNDILVRLVDQSNSSGRGPVLLFVDTCRAGGASPKEYINESLGHGLLFFGASGTDENAIESSEWQNGAFTKAVLEGLSGSADQSFVGRPPDGKIDFLELRQWIETRVQELNASQNPKIVTPEGLKRFVLSITPNPMPRTDRTCPEVQIP